MVVAGVGVAPTCMSLHAHLCALVEFPARDLNQKMASRPGAAPGNWVLETRLRKLAPGLSKVVGENGILDLYRWLFEITDAAPLELGILRACFYKHDAPPELKRAAFSAVSNSNGITLANGPEVVWYFRPGSFQQRTNTSWSSGDANPRIHGGCFGV